MIALETNILVFAHRGDMAFHAESSALLNGLANGAQRWAIPWPCIHEFVGVVTNARIYTHPTPLPIALDSVHALIACTNLDLLAEGAGYFDELSALALAAKLRGAAIHDARIADLCKHQGVKELWSADRDFSRFPDIKVRNPLLASAR